MCKMMLYVLQGRTGTPGLPGRQGPSGWQGPTGPKVSNYFPPVFQNSSPMLHFFYSKIKMFEKIPDEGHVDRNDVNK